MVALMQKFSKTVVFEKTVDCLIRETSLGAYQVGAVALIPKLCPKILIFVNSYVISMRESEKPIVFGNVTKLEFIVMTSETRQNNPNNCPEY